MLKHFFLSTNFRRKGDTSKGSFNFLENSSKKEFINSEVLESYHILENMINFVIL